LPVVALCLEHAHALKVGPDGRVPVGYERLRAGVAAGTRVVHCLHPNGNITILRSRTQIRPKTRYPPPGPVPLILSAFDRTLLFAFEILTTLF
jgi:hypothetical protein